MAFYHVKVWDSAVYPCIEADSPEQAEQIALEWFSERFVATSIQEIHPNCENCFHRYHDDQADSVSCCNCCENYEFYAPIAE